MFKHAQSSLINRHACIDNNDTSYGYEGPLKRAIDVANHYGFTLSRPLTINKEDLAFGKKHHCPAHHVAALRTFVTNDVQQGNVILAAHTRKVPYKKNVELRLEIIGDKESSAEGLLFQTVQAILQEYGLKEASAMINSVGGRESVATYVQAISSYYRSHLHELEPSCREAFKESVFAPLRCNHNKCIAVRNEAPQAINYLSEPSRAHFKEVLEYLESLEIPYSLDPFLVSPEQYASRTIFSFNPSDNDSNSNNPIAYGERYDSLSRRLGHKRSIPAIQATLSLPMRTVKERYIIQKRQSKTPPIFVVQVGLQAKIKTLSVGEHLRKARIRVHSVLHKNSVSEQMDKARKLGSPLVVIIGQKEVFDGAAIVRNMITNQQDAVPFARLSEYLKRRSQRA
jgi:histidyl-tRNA synthetase